MKTLQELHEIPNLVDDSGEAVEQDFDDQADLCEIVRAAIAAGKFAKITTDLQNIPTKILDAIDCPGDPGQTELCAVTGSSYFQNTTWYMFLEGLSISINDKPKFIPGGGEDDNPADNIPEAKKEMLRDLENKANGGAGGAGGDGGAGGSGGDGDGDNNGDGGNNQDANKKPDKNDMTKIENTDESGSSACADLNNGNKYEPFGAMELKLSMKSKQIAIVFGTASGTFATPSHIVTRLSKDGETVKGSVSWTGNLGRYSVVNGMMFQSQQGGDKTLSFEYRTPGNVKNGKSCPANVDTDNRNMGALLIHGEKIFQKDLKKRVTIKKVKNWSKLNELKLSLTLSKEMNVLAYYNLRFESPKNKELAAQLKIMGQEKKHSIFATSTDQYARLTGWAFGKLEKGDVELEYVSGEDSDIKVDEEDRGAGYIAAVALPDSANINEANLQTSTTLDKTDTWAEVQDMKVSIDADKKKNIFGWARTTSFLEKMDKFFFIRVLMDGEEIQMSRTGSNGLDKTTAFSTFVAKVDKGSHTFTLQYKSEDEVKISAGNNYEGVSLVIADFDLEQ